VIAEGSELQGALARAGELLQQGQFEQAAETCRSVLAKVSDHAAATHLLGLAHARRGDSAEAESLLRRSLSLEPANHQFRVNFGNFLRRLKRLSEAEAEYRQVLDRFPGARKARHQLALTLDDLGRRAEAEAEARRSLAENPHEAESWSLLGFVLSNGGRLLEAEQSYRRALELTPNYGIAHHNLGSVLMQMERAEEALAALERAQALGVEEFELRFTRARALMLLYRPDEAEQEYVRAVAERPRHLDAQANLARLRFMRGDPFFTRSLEEALRSAPDDLALHSALASILFRAGRQGQAEILLRDVLKKHGSPPQFRTQLAYVLLEQARFQEAEVEALEAANAESHNAGAVDVLVTALLARARPEEALPFVLAKRAQEPMAQNWIAHEAVTARLMGRPRYRELFDYQRLVRRYRLESPPGWSSMREFNSALVEVLEVRHVFAAHPLDQSLRHGSQTTRNLVFDRDPVIQAALRSFEAAVQEYMTEVGAQAAHPFRKRNIGAARIAEGWSIQLRRDGFHVNHVHPKGWISSAYYVSVPDEVKDDQLRSGWLKFGEPRYPVPTVAPDFMVQPQAGTLVLFPSYIWHGTTAIQGENPRTTMAFDALPGPGNIQAQRSK
jgi:Flp pilus assembly protein TadD